MFHPDLGLEGLALDGEEEVAFLDQLPLLEVAVAQETGDAGTYFHLLQRLHASDELCHLRDRLPVRRHDYDGRRLGRSGGRRLGLLLFVAAEKEEQRHQRYQSAA